MLSIGNRLHQRSFQFIHCGKTFKPVPDVPIRIHNKRPAFIQIILDRGKSPIVNDAEYLSLIQVPLNFGRVVVYLNVYVICKSWVFLFKTREGIDLRTAGGTSAERRAGEYDH